MSEPGYAPELKPTTAEPQASKAEHGTYETYIEPPNSEVVHQLPDGGLDPAAIQMPRSPDTLISKHSVRGFRDRGTVGTDRLKTARAGEISTGDATKQSITPAWARSLDDARLRAEIHEVETGAGVITHAAERETAERNLGILVTEQRRRAAAAGMPHLEPTDLGRPPGLPADTAFQLIPVQDAPSSVVDKMVEGQLMEVVPGKGLQPVSAGAGGPGAALASIPATAPVPDSRTAQVLQVAGSGAYGAIAGGNAIVMSQGFAAAGDNAIGLIAIPQIRNTFGPNANPLIDLARPTSQWGHTAMYVRQNGKIVSVRGFGPQFSADFLKQAGAVGEGNAATAGAIANDLSMFKSTMARTVEYPIDPAIARSIAGQHPTGSGGTGGSPTNWTGKPNVYAAQHGGPSAMCTTQNCVMYAVEQIEGHLKGPVGVAGQGSIVNAPSSGTPAGVGPRGTASQGKLYGALADAEVSKVTLSQPPGATGPAVVGRMPAALRYMKWGGRVFIVIGIAAGAYEVYAAPAEQRGRTAVGVAGGMAGGFAGGALGGAAAGAAIGLVCGPGAPVCSLVLGISGGLIGGVVGALGGRALAEAAYDDVNTPATPIGPRLATGKLSAECPSCHKPMNKTEPSEAGFLGASSLLATALMANPQGAAAANSKTLTENEITIIANYLGIKTLPHDANAAPADATH